MKRWLLVGALLASTSAQASVTFVPESEAANWSLVPISDWTSTFSQPFVPYSPHGPIEYYATFASPVHMYTTSGSVDFMWGNITAAQYITVGGTTYSGAQALAGCISCGLFGIDNAVVSVSGPSSADITLNGGGIPFIVGFAEPPVSLFSASVVPRFSASAVPEPSTWAMMLLGFGLLFAFKRRKAAPALQ